MASQPGTVASARPAQRKAILLRLDPGLYDALARWGADEFRSANAQIEFVLRQALLESGRLHSPVVRRRRFRSPEPAGVMPGEAAGGRQAG